MSNAESLIMDIISNPFNSNYYRNFAKYYQDLNRENEYLALLDLVNLKYEPTNSDPNQEQRKND
jgi:hypothetical protein